MGQIRRDLQRKRRVRPVIKDAKEKIAAKGKGDAVRREITKQKLPRPKLLPQQAIKVPITTAAAVRMAARANND